MSEVDIPNAVSQRVSGRERFLAIPSRQNNGELLSAIARWKVVFTFCRVAETAPDQFQATVASQVAIHVVIGLETVDIDEEKGKRICPFCGVLNLLRQSTIERTAVRDAGKSIGFCQPFHLLGKLPQDENIADTETPRLCRRPFGLSYAAMAGTSSMA